MTMFDIIAAMYVPEPDCLSKTLQWHTHWALEHLQHRRRPLSTLPLGASVLITMERQKSMHQVALAASVPSYSLLLL